jgi:phasin family protein
MAESAQSLMEMLKKLGSDLRLPQLDVEKLIEGHRKNIDALVRSAQVASEGAKSVADKQREIIEAAFSEAAAMVRDYKAPGSPQEALERQTEFARKAFDVAIQNTRDTADLAKKSTAEATRIIQDRLREGMEELRAGFNRSADVSKKE